MASKKKRKKSTKSSSPAKSKAAATKTQPKDDGAKPSIFQREVRPYIYAGICFVLAIVYVVLFTVVMPNRHGWVNALLYSFPLAIVVLGVSTLVRKPRAWWVAIIAGSYLLLAWIVTLILILMTAGFLAGVYGAMGKAASMFALMTAVLSFQLVALLPMLQLKFLMTRAGRRWFHLEPIWG